MKLEHYPYLNEDHKSLVGVVRTFAEKEVAPGAAARDRSHEFPADLVKKMGEMGLLGMNVSPEYGGAGIDDISYALTVEEIAVACASTAVILSAHNSLCIHPIDKFGTQEQKKKFLPDLCSGKKLGCLGLTEANAGSDAGGTRTMYRADGDHWILTGTKNFITNGPQADVAIVMASRDRTQKHKGISAFIVEKGTPGFRVGKIEDKLGINASGTSELILEEVRIPKSHLLSGEGDGFKIAMNTLDGGRIGIAAQALGIGRAALEFAKKYAKERQQFDQPIAHFQAISFMIADMATRLESARLLTHRAALLKSAGVARYSEQSAMAKLSASEAAMWVTTKAIQVLGGYGYIKEFPVERFFRDAKITEIYEGTSEIQRVVISNSQLKD